MLDIDVDDIQEVEYLNASPSDEQGAVKITLRTEALGPMRGRSFRRRWKRCDTGRPRRHKPGLGRSDASPANRGRHESARHPSFEYPANKPAFRLATIQTNKPIQQ